MPPTNAPRAAPSLVLGLADLSGRAIGTDAQGRRRAVLAARRLLDLVVEHIHRRYEHRDRPAADVGVMLLGYRTGGNGRELFRPLLPGTREPDHEWLTVDEIMATLRGKPAPGKPVAWVPATRLSGCGAKTR